MIPIMGFCLLSLFAGYAIYFPELFPTHLRSTGTSFCYNVGRFVAAAGPLLLGYLTSVVYADTSEPLRYAGLTMCGISSLVCSCCRSRRKRRTNRCRSSRDWG